MISRAAWQVLAAVLATGFIAPAGILALSRDITGLVRDFAFFEVAR